MGDPVEAVVGKGRDIFRGEVIGGKLCDSIEGHAIWLGEDELPGRLEGAIHM